MNSHSVATAATSPALLATEPASATWNPWRLGPAANRSMGTFAALPGPNPSNGTFYPPGRPLVCQLPLADRGRRNHSEPATDRRVPPGTDDRTDPNRSGLAYVHLTRAGCGMKVLCLSPLMSGPDHRVDLHGAGRAPASTTFPCTMGHPGPPKVPSSGRGR
jgi:hypothetical protein